MNVKKVASSLKQRNTPSDSVKYGTFLVYLSICELLKNDSDAYCQSESRIWSQNNFTDSFIQNFFL